MAAAADYDFEIHDLLVVCGITSADARNAIIQEGFTTADQFSRITPSEVETMVKNLRQPRGNEPGVRIGAVPMKNLKALVWWARDRKRRDREIVIEDFTNDVLEECIVKLEMDDADEQTKVDAPGMLKGAEDWVQWELSLHNYLMNVKGVSGIPLAYVIRKEILDVDDYVFENEVERLIHEAPHEGPAFAADNQQVYRIIQSKLVGTENYEWISKYETSQDGRSTMNTLRTHYDGPGEVKRRIARAEAQIEALYYKSEQALSFERFITKLNGAFQVLEQNKEGLTERKKVTLMCEKIQNTNPDFRAAVQFIRRTEGLSTNFREAANALSEHVSMIFPTPDKPQVDRFKRKMSGVGSEREGGRGSPGRFSRGGRAGRGRGNSGRAGRGGGRFNRTTGGDTSLCNGVDISNIERNFTPEEWRKLPNLVRDSIRSARERKRARHDGSNPRISSISTQDQGGSNNEVSSNIPPVARGGGNSAGRAFGRNAYAGRGQNTGSRGGGTDGQQDS